ncbi:PREDICTED: uncharacterized protein LOC109587109 [Amphimedon queenslandica]|uniref:Uncharacterized protein n=1 Tax=Amphimedon queenslandica TaxID=400682 RepID=A0AAN0JPF5_AMPQE|nr:PREDICTED: uncharacterized protein LOC109587109 [Amphimedon queenslandica]|eukprot:XP_019858894.1 PREDICTED: uncharacterized protein LOC109587109 [Amphimedon queenslandica]
MEQMKINLHPRQICIIASTRKQLNHIRDMANKYKEYEAVRKVSFKPSFMIQGHEFQAIFLSLFEPIENDELNAFYVKSLFNPFVFNTVITRAKFRVVAVGRLNEVQQFENDTLSHPCRSDNTVKCWHEYLSLCRRQGTLHNENIGDRAEASIPNLEPNVLPQIDTRGGGEITLLKKKLKCEVQEVEQASVKFQGSFSEFVSGKRRGIKKNNTRSTQTEILEEKFALIEFNLEELEKEKLDVLEELKGVKLISAKKDMQIEDLKNENSKVLKELMSKKDEVAALETKLSMRQYQKIKCKL